MGYRFLTVEVDTARQVLRVGDQEVSCQPRVYQLLVLLCRAGGAVVRREELFASLWEGDTIPSDESLTQLVHRLRATLGAGSRAVRTVRGVGFRLDCEVEAVAGRSVPPPGMGPRPAAAPGTSGAQAPATAAPERPGTGRPDPFETGWREPPAAALGPDLPRARAGVAPAAAWLGRGAAAWWALALLPLLAAAGWLALARPWQMIDPGWALRRGDLATGRSQTVELVSRALAAQRIGDRAQARQLLATAHATDPATPVPAAFLCLFSPWQEGMGEAERWAAAAERRLRPSSSPYLHLLVRFARAAAQGRGPEYLAASSALLALRPSAFFPRLARAHYHLAHREEAATLADLEQISIHSLTDRSARNDRSLALVLADRASLGDVAGAERDLASWPRGGQDALAWYVRGRIARSRWQAAAALAAFDRELAAAIGQNQPDLVAEARLDGALAAAEAGDLAGAASRFDLAAAESRAEHRPDVAIDALGLGAYLAWRRGDAAGRDRRLAEAEALHAEPVWPYRLALALLALWSGAQPTAAPGALAAQVPLAPELTGVGELLRAREALTAGSRDEAGRRLRRAREEGVAQTYFSEEAALLAADLGEPARPRWIDPPYPNQLRFAAAWELDRRLAGTDLPRAGAVTTPAARPEAGQPPPDRRHGGRRDDRGAPR
jgi:DNA-binding winged helix-turn-helix (wHTH) protein